MNNQEYRVDIATDEELMHLKNRLSHCPFLSSLNFSCQDKTFTENKHEYYRTFILKDRCGDALGATCILVSLRVTKTDEPVEAYFALDSIFIENECRGKGLANYLIERASVWIKKDVEFRMSEKILENGRIDTFSVNAVHPASEVLMRKFEAKIK